MTQRLGANSEYGGSLQEQPRRKVGVRSPDSSGGSVKVVSPRARGRRTLEVEVALVAPLVEDVLDAAGALSELLLGTETSWTASSGWRRCEGREVETVVRKEQS